MATVKTTANLADYSRTRADGHGFRRAAFNLERMTANISEG
jgi:hypothetical protein